MKNTIRFGSLLSLVVAFGCMQSSPEAEKAEFFDARRDGGRSNTT